MEGKRRELTFRCALYLTTPFLLLSQEHFLFLKMGEREGGREGGREDNRGRRRRGMNAACCTPDHPVTIHPILTSCPLVPVELALHGPMYALAGRFGGSLTARPASLLPPHPSFLLPASSFLTHSSSLPITSFILTFVFPHTAFSPSSSTLPSPFLSFSSLP